MSSSTLEREAPPSESTQETLLTTQQAADFLGISRSSLVSLVDSDEIDFERSERHRKIRLADVIDLGQRISARRRASLARMVEIAEQSGMYHKTASPKLTR